MFTEAQLMGFVELFSSYFYNTEGDKYSLIGMPIPIRVLNVVYKRLLTDPEVIPIEKISKEKKMFFWGKALKYYESNEKRVSAAIAAYTITLITSTE